MQGAASLKWFCMCACLLTTLLYMSYVIISGLIRGEESAAARYKSFPVFLFLHSEISFPQHEPPSVGPFCHGFIHLPPSVAVNVA